MSLNFQFSPLSQADLTVTQRRLKGRKSTSESRTICRRKSCPASKYNFLPSEIAAISICCSQRFYLPRNSPCPAQLNKHFLICKLFKTICKLTGVGYDLHVLYHKSCYSVLMMKYQKKTSADTLVLPCT